MKRRILSSLMALVLVFGLLPVSAMAASSTDLDADVPELARLGDTYIQRRTPQQNEQGGVKNSTISVPVQNYSLVTNEPGTYQRLPMAGNNYAIYTPTNYAVPATANVTVSEEGIIGNCSFTLGKKLYNGRYYPCLQFDYKALQEGTVTVTLHYYYNYALPKTVNGTVWWKEDATFTVTVGEQVKPTGKPVVSNFTDEISLKCIDSSAHDASADFDDSSVTEGYSFGDIIDNDGANDLFPVDEFPWMCVMTFNTRAYLDAYNSVLSSRYGTHYLAENQDAEKTFTFYSRGNKKWSYDSEALPVVIDITHVEPTPGTVPEKPDADNLYRGEYVDSEGNVYENATGITDFAVVLQCERVTNDHIYGFRNLSLVPDGYTLGDVVDNEDENTKTAYPYTCTMTVDYTKYVDQANRDYQGEDGEHEIVAGTKTTREIVWYYNRASKSWIVLAENDRAPIVIPVTCEKAPDADMLETAVENVKLYVDCETVDSHNRQAIALNGYDKATVTTKPYTVARTDKTATVIITDQQAYADQYKPDGAAHTYDRENPSNHDRFTMEWKKGEGGWNWYLKGEPALIMTKCTPVPTEDDVKKALDGLEKDVRVTCVTKKNNHGSETYAVKLGLPENWRLGEETNWNGHIGYEVEAPTSSFVKLFISKHGTHTVKVGMPETLRWVIYWDGSSWKAAAHGNPAEIEVEHVNAPDTYQVTVKNSTATNSGAGFYEAGKTVTIHAGSRSNYTFIGWTTSSGVTFANAAKADTTFKMPAKAVEVTANWKYTGSDSDNDKDDDYTLKYVTNGGKVISSETKSRSWVKDYEDLPTPIRSGYRFEGWYYDTRLTDKVTDDVKVNKTVVTLYARWSSSETPGMLNDEDHFAYVQGYSDGNVHPYGLISRAETTTIFFRLLTDEVRDDNLLTSNTYTDVTNDYWANTAISTMTGLGIVQGRSATTFDPKAPITRAQFAAICARFDTGTSSGSRTFSDISGHWAEKYIERAAELGWIQGFADGTFRPDTYITRAQAMTMINRVLNRTPEDEEDLLEGMKVWPDCNPGDWFYLAVQEATNSHDYKDRGGEVWTKLTRDPDWTRYEH